VTVLMLELLELVMTLLLSVPLLGPVGDAARDDSSVAGVDNAVAAACSSAATADGSGDVGAAVGASGDSDSTAAAGSVCDARGADGDGTASPGEAGDNAPCRW